MRLRKIGTMRPKNTALPPCRSNHATVRSTSSGCRSGTFAAIARSRAAPSQRPSPYSANAPTTDPRVVHSSASKSVNEPRLAVRPAIGSTTSLGSGGKRFSRAMAMPAPTGPMISIRETVQSASDVSQDSSPEEESADAPRRVRVLSVIGCLRAR